VEKDRYCVELTSDFIDNMGEFENIILNLMAGMQPDDLSEEEIEVLKEKYGEQWKQELGYE